VVSGGGLVGADDDEDPKEAARQTGPSVD
jgi:hypothetical protein